MSLIPFIVSLNSVEQLQKMSLQDGGIKTDGWRQGLAEYRILLKKYCKTAAQPRGVFSFHAFSL